MGGAEWGDGVQRSLVNRLRGLMRGVRGAGDAMLAVSRVLYDSFKVRVFRGAFWELGAHDDSAV